MTYRKYKSALFIRVTILFLSLLGLAYAISIQNYYIVVTMGIASLISLSYLYKFIIRRFIEMDDFFESVKYRDFSRWFTEKSGPEDIKMLHKGFNEVNKTVKEISAKQESQYLYLQKILEMIDAGIIAYNIESGSILWVNELLAKTLNIPIIKNISFLEKRKPKLYTDLFEINHVNGNTIAIEVEKETTQVLVSSSIFQIEEDSFKLIVLQNIDHTLNQNESDAWKKLLSVMTHEIMNSIAPISSLAETLQNHVRLSIDNPVQNPLDMNDLDAGIESIKKRSEGLMKFAKTYRSLNKITSINPSKVLVNELFENIKNLMHPSLNSKGVELSFMNEHSDLSIEIDTYLIEQVLINLILNSVEACEEQDHPKIVLIVKKDIDGHAIIKVVDNGKGIPHEITDKIFVPFFTTKKSGSGIGLSLCKQIMVLHKGKIQINSIDGKGTAISLVF